MKPAGPRASRSVGQRGRQRAILREGVYAINLALFVVITDDAVYRLDVGGQRELKTLVSWQTELNEVLGFLPVVIGGPVEAPDPFLPGKTILVDSMGIVTVQDGPSLGRARSSPRRSAPTGTRRTSTTTTRTPRRSSAPAGGGACSTCR